MSKALKVDRNRYDLLAALAGLPDEAFSWFVGWASGAMVQFPDGLGGFLPQSRLGIAALRNAAKDYAE